MKVEYFVEIGKEEIALFLAQEHLHLDWHVEVKLHNLQIAHVLLLGVYELVDDLLHLHLLLGHLLESMFFDINAQIGQLFVHLHVRVGHPRMSAQHVLTTAIERGRRWHAA